MLTQVDPIDPICYIVSKTFKKKVIVLNFFFFSQIMFVIFLISSCLAYF